MCFVDNNKWSKEIKDKCIEYYLYFKDKTDKTGKDLLSWVYDSESYVYAFGCESLRSDLSEGEILSKLENAIDTKTPIIAKDLLNIEWTRNFLEPLENGFVY